MKLEQQRNLVGSRRRLIKTLCIERKKIPNSKSLVRLVAATAEAYP